MWGDESLGCESDDPYVHTGVIYLASRAICQALNGKNRQSIWETRVGPEQAPGGAPQYRDADDKIFADNDAACGAERQERRFWGTRQRNRTARCVNTSGTVVIETRC